MRPGRAVPGRRSGRPCAGAVLFFILLLLGAGLLAGCAVRPRIESGPLDPPPRRIDPPPLERNLVRNGGFEEGPAEEPSGWTRGLREASGGVLRAVAIPDAPEGRRVAEASLDPSREPNHGIAFVQMVRVAPSTTYELSVRVRGIGLVSGVLPPYGFGAQCGLTFWLLGPDGTNRGRLFPSAATPRRDGTTPWELRTMRFTTPPQGVFPTAGPGRDDRYFLQIRVQLFGIGTVQVDDVRLARSTASPPPPRRVPGRLALAQVAGKPFFGMGLHRLPEGIGWKELAREGIFNFTTGPGSWEDRAALGIYTLGQPWVVDPACRGCAKTDRRQCAYCRLCPDDRGRCGVFDGRLLAARGALGAWIDEPNASPWIQGDLEDLIASARRIREQAAKLRGGRPYYLFESDLPSGVHFNTYGWDDLALYHASEAFDIVGALRRGGNPPPGLVGGSMSEFPQTGINGIRQSTRRVAGDVTDAGGRQGKPVWMLVNGGSYRIVDDPEDPQFGKMPRNEEELRAWRPSLRDLRYMLLAAVLNGATGLHFYQDSGDRRLTRDDPYWTDILLPAAAELATLERDTEFLTRPGYNDLPHRLTGPEADAVDSMIKRAGEAWILAVANSSPEPAPGLALVLKEGGILEGEVERLEYRHDSDPRRRRFAAEPAGRAGGDRFAFGLPGYGVALFRFRTAGAIPRGRG